MIENLDFSKVLEIAEEAGEAIMKIYRTDFKVEYKDDKSPLTAADKAANDVIIAGLKNLDLDIPIISEENKTIEYADRKDWTYCWIVDPLDGTKEFLKRNDEFTVNIALVNNGKLEGGVVYVPVTEEFYYAEPNGKAWYKRGDNIATSISAQKPEGDTVVIMGSRSHMNEETEQFVEEQKQKFKNVEFIAAGSSLKLCKVAQGLAHFYPRFAPTMEWDTAAGQAVVEAAGGKVLRHPEMTPLLYNKENLLNPYFLVSA